MLLVLTTLSKKKKKIHYLHIYTQYLDKALHICAHCLILHEQGIATSQHPFPKQYVKESSIITNLHQKFFLYMIVSVMYILYV